MRTVVYLTRQKIRLAQFNVTHDGCSLVKEKIIPLTLPEFDAAAVKSIVHKEGFSSQGLVSCLFRHEVGVRFFSFPSHDAKEIARMVRYESAELLPLKPEETTTRFLVMNMRPDGYAETLVVVSHQEEITKRMGRFQSAGLSIDALNLSSLALLSCLRKVTGGGDGQAAPRTVMAVYCEDAAVEILIMKDGKLALSRGFLVNDQKTFSQVLISEVRHSMEAFFHAAQETNIERVVVGGRDTDLAPVVETLEAYFGFPVTVDKRIDIAGGLANPGEYQVNLLSDELLTDKARARLKKKIAVAGMLLLLNIVLVGMLFTGLLRNKERFLGVMEARLARLGPQAQAVQDKLTKLQLAHQQLSSQILILDALTDVINATASTCTLNLFSINEEGTLIVRGQAESLQEVLDFVAELEKSAHIGKSRLNYSSRRKTKDKELLDFEIQAELRKEQ